MSTSFSRETFCCRFDPLLAVETGLEMEDIDMVSWSDTLVSSGRTTAVALGETELAKSVYFNTLFENNILSHCVPVQADFLTAISSVMMSA